MNLGSLYAYLEALGIRRSTGGVPTTRTVNGHPLSADVVVTAADVGAPSGSGTSTGTNTGDQDLSGLVPNTRTVNGHALSGNITVTAADVGAPSGSGTSTGTNTGDQDLSGYQTTSGLAAAVRAVVLTGLSTATNAAIVAGDTILAALGKLQAQISANTTSISGKQDTLVSGTNIKTINSTSLLGSGNISISASPGGSSGNMQGNISGAFAAIPGWTFDTTTGAMSQSYTTTSITPLSLNVTANAKWASFGYAGSEYIKFGTNGLGYGMFSGSVYSGYNGYAIGSSPVIYSNGDISLSTNSAALATFNLASNTTPVVKVLDVGLTTKPAFEAAMNTSSSAKALRVTKGGSETFAVTAAGAVSFSALLSVGQYTNATEPSYIKGAVFYNNDLSKLRVGGASAWETVTST